MFSTHRSGRTGKYKLLSLFFFISIDLFDLRISFFISRQILTDKKGDYFVCLIKLFNKVYVFPVQQLNFLKETLATDSHSFLE